MKAHSGSLGRRNVYLLFFSLALLFFVANEASAQDSSKADTTKQISFSKDVAPILNKFCVTCHNADDQHPSELYMDDYESLMKGGKHGKAIVPGNSKQSLLFDKMSDKPPFGKIMPPPGKRRPTDEQIAVICQWVDQGAKKN